MLQQLKWGRHSCRAHSALSHLDEDAAGAGSLAKVDSLYRSAPFVHSQLQKLPLLGLDPAMCWGSLEFISKSDETTYREEG